MDKLFFIHGGNIWKNKEAQINYLENHKYYSLEKSKKWSDYIAENLLDNYEFIKPVFVCKDNADFDLWSIVFKKYLNLIRAKNENDEKIIFIAHSLGVIFLLKYLSLNNINLSIKALFLVAGLYNDKNEYLANFIVENDLRDLLKLNKLKEDQLYFYHSKDDFIVNFSNLDSYRQIFPFANYRIFMDRGHFLGDEFSDLLDDILKIT